MPNLNELREVVEHCKQGMIISKPDFVILLALATEVIGAEIPKEREAKYIDSPDAIQYNNESFLRTEGYNQALHDFRIYQAKKMAGLERIIAEFIPHKDSEYIKPLADAIREEMK
jgi:hypothetical protein